MTLKQPVRVLLWSASFLLPVLALCKVDAVGTSTGDTPFAAHPNGKGVSDIRTIPPAVNLAISAVLSDHPGGVQVSCPGATDGTIDLTVSGGTPPMSFGWTGPNGFSGNTEDLTGLAPGTYFVDVTDAMGNSVQGTYSLNAPPPIGLSATPSSYPGGWGVSCPGTADGSIQLSVSGGVAPYTFAWSSGPGFSSSDQDIDLINAGTYSVLVTDANGCAAQLDVTLTAPPTLSLSAVLSAYNGHGISCNGGSDGVIDLTVAGGTPAYAYDWVGMATTQDLNGVSAGSYTVVVTDTNGCKNTAQYTLTQPAGLSASATTSSYIGGFAVSCSGGTNGSIDLAIAGGVSPYTVAWSGPDGYTAAAEDINGLAAGTYNATITDMNGCALGLTVTLDAPDPIIPTIQVASDTNGYHIPCAGGISGPLTSQVIGGRPGYVHDWFAPDGTEYHTPDLPGMPAGPYNLMVTDTNGCKAITGVLLLSPPPLSITATLSDAGNGHHVGCSGNDGAIDVEVNGGTAPYDHVWTGPNGFSATTEDISGATAGTHVLVVTDAYGCTAFLDTALTQASQIAAVLQVTANECQGDSSGSISTQVNGGTAPYAFSWTGPGGASWNTADINGLTAGTYVLDITDDAGCTWSTTALVADGPQLAFHAVTSDHGSFDLACFGDSSGSITFAPTGGSGPYSFNTSGPGGMFSTQGSLNSLVAGTYTVSLTDANGCTADTTIILTEPPAALSSVLQISTYPSGTNIACHGSSDGWIDATTIGGVAPYAFDWLGPDGAIWNVEDLSGVPAGAYVLTITDANACTFSLAASLTEPDTALHVNITTSQYPGGVNVSCADMNDGMIHASIAGGSGGTTMAWTGPFGTLAGDTLLSALPGGEYTYTLSDTNNCIVSDIVTLVVPDSLQVLMDIPLFPGGTAISCADAGDGAINASIFGGTPGYVPAWTGPGGFSAYGTVLQGLSPGQYCLSVTDINGCMAQQCSLITAPAALEADIQVLPAACGEAVGAMDLTCLGGSAPYAFLWNTEATTEDLVGLPSGAYSVTVTDLNGCTTTIDTSIGGTDAVLAEAVVTHALCSDGDEGGIAIDMVQGAAPFIHSWSNGAASEDLVGLGAGTYTLTVTDANGCSFTESYIVTAPQAIGINSTVSSFVNGHNISVAGASNGSVTVNTFGGTPPYAHEWSNGLQGPAIQGLGAGPLTLTVTDANGCIAQFPFVLSGPPAVEMPSGFTPNGDGANDTFIIHGLESFARNRFQVMNRWGGMVLDIPNYRNDWDGTNMNGEPLANGTYFVLLTLNGGEITLQHYVDLRR